MISYFQNRCRSLVASDKSNYFPPDTRRVCSKKNCNNPKYLHFGIPFKYIEEIITQFLRQNKEFKMYFTRPILTYRSYQNGQFPPPHPCPFKAVHRVENNIVRISLEGYSWNEMFILFRLPEKQTKHKTTFINSRSTPQLLTIILTLGDISTIYNLNHSSCTFSKP